MKTKRIAIAVAIFGGMLFFAQESNIIDLNEQTTTEIERKRIKIPSNG